MHTSTGLCECGKPAIKGKNHRYRKCDDCRELDRRNREIDNHYANRGRVKPETKASKDPEEVSEVSTAVDTIVASAMERLESMLKSVDSPA